MFEDLKRKYASNTNNNASKITTFEDLKKKYAGSTKIVGKQPTTTQTNSLGVPVTSSGDPSSDFQRFAVGVGVGGVTEVAKPVMVARENIKEDEIAREKALDEMGITNPIHRTALKMGDAIQEFGNDVGNTIWNAPTNVINWFLPEDKKLKTLTTDDRTTFINQDKYRTRTEQEVAEYVNQLQDKAIRMYGGVTKEGNTTKWAEVGKVYGNLLTLLTTNVGLKGVGANSTPALFGTHGAISGYANEGTTEGAITEGVKGAIMGKVFDNLSPVLNNVSNKVLGKYATNAGAQYGSGIVQGGIKFGAGNALGQFADIMKADPNGRYINQQELENMIKDGQIQNEEDLQREMMKQIAINRVIETGMSSLQGMLFNALFGVRTAKAKANMAGFKMEMSTQDAYKILGLDKNVTPEQIKSQYRKLAKQYHPDAHYGESAESIKQYEIKMKEITNAYDTLFKTFPAKNTTQASTQATQNNNNLMVLNPAENRLATNLGVATQRSGINTNLTMNNNQINKVNKSDIKPNIQDIQEIELDTQNFSRQVDEVIKGTFPNGDMLVVCKNTPKMLKDIGLTNLPITMTQKHLDTIMNETGKYKKANYHNLGIDIVKQLPEAISNPLDIVKSNTKDDSIILTTHLADKNNNTVIASIKLDGKGTVNDIRIDTNVMTSAYGKDNYETFMKKSIENDNILYDIDRGVIKKVTGERLQLPIRSNFSSVSNVPNTSINNSIQQNDTTVNSYSTQKTENNTLGLENNDKWQKYLDENLSLMPNATRTIIEKRNNAIANDSLIKFEENRRKKHSLIDLSKMKKEDADTTPIYEHKAKDGTSKKTRQFYDNVKHSNIISDKVKKELTPTTYNEITNKESMDKAYKRLEEGGQEEVELWLGKSIKKDKFDNIDIAEGFILLHQAQAVGNMKTTLSIIDKLAEIGTKAGQQLQMYSLLKRLTPEGMQIYAKKELERAWEVYREGKSAEWEKQNKDKFELTEDDAMFIKRNMEALQETEDQRKKDILLAEISKRISDKLPPEEGQGIKSYLRISMLFNPKTQVRNVLGNAGLVPVNAVADTIATFVDKAVAKKTGVRTTNFMNVKTYWKGFKKGAYETIDDFKRGINTNAMGNRYELKNDNSLLNPKSFNENTNNKVLNAFNKKMNTVDNVLSTALTLGDRPFYEASFLNSIEGQMKANNVKVPSQEMIDIAVNEALERTWQDNNDFTKFVLGIRKGLNKLNIKGYGLGDILIPFAKTPANLTKAIVKYSPLNAISTLIKYHNLNENIKKGEFTPQMQKKFVDDLGKTFAGTLLYLIGYGLAQSGVISGGGDEDKDIANFNKNVRGVQPYSFKIGDTSFTYNWLIPATVPFAIVTDLTKEEKNWFNTLLNAIKISADTLVAQSFMASINKIFNNYDGVAQGVIEAVLDLPARAVPTLVKQIADMVDETSRNTYESGNPTNSALNYAKSKIPFLSKTLPTSTNTMGEEIRKYGGDNNLFNVFFNPANVTKDTSTKATNEIYRVYEETSNKNVFPKVAPNSITYQKQKITLTPNERVAWQKTSGNYISNNINKLINSNEYKMSSEEKKAKMIENLVEKAYEVAKLKFLKERN